jgi:hypothetical protein
MCQKPPDEILSINEGPPALPGDGIKIVIPSAAKNLDATLDPSLRSGGRV